MEEVCVRNRQPNELNEFFIRIAQKKVQIIEYFTCEWNIVPFFLAKEDRVEVKKNEILELKRSIHLWSKLLLRDYVEHTVSHDSPLYRSALATFKAGIHVEIHEKHIPDFQSMDPAMRSECILQLESLLFPDFIIKAEGAICDAYSNFMDEEGAVDLENEEEDNDSEDEEDSDYVPSSSSESDSYESDTVSESEEDEEDIL